MKVSIVYSHLSLEIFMHVYELVIWIFSKYSPECDLPKYLAFTTNGYSKSSSLNSFLQKETETIVSPMIEISAS